MIDLLQRAAQRWPTAVAICDGAGQTISYEELEKATRPTKRSGIPGQIEAFFPPLHPQADALMELWRKWRAGLTLPIINPRWPDAFQQEQLQQLGTTCLPSLANHPTILWTSGSRGIPRALAHSWAAHIYSAAGAASRIPIRPGDGWLLNLSLAHVGGVAIIFRSVLSGATIILPTAAYSLPDGITHLSLVPSQLRTLRKQPPPPKLKAVLVGGAPCPTIWVREAVDLRWPVHTTYGMTEAGSQICTSSVWTKERLDQISQIPSGHPLAGRRVSIAPDHQIQISGPTLATGSIAQGRLHPLAQPYATGDVGALTPNGELVVHGREDRMFQCGGENVHPEFIETILESRPTIKKAFVTWMPDQRFERVPVALVQWTDEPENDTELIGALRKQLPPWLVPRHLADWPDSQNSDQEKISTHKLETWLRNQAN
ncbi:MAG: AMP-binding protein [Verrucomicrobiales bacterium]